MSEAYIEVQSTASLTLADSSTATFTRATPASWTSGGTTTITATGSNPTKGTVSLDTVYYRDTGESVDIWVKYYHTAPSGTPGSGDYLYTLPNSFQFDTSVHPVYTGTTNAAACGYGIPTSGHIRNDSSASAYAFVVPYSSTSFRIFVFRYDANHMFRQAATYFGMDNINLGVSVNFTFKKS